MENEPAYKQAMDIFKRLESTFLSINELSIKVVTSFCWNKLIPGQNYVDSTKAVEEQYQKTLAALNARRLHLLQQIEAKFQAQSMYFSEYD